MIELLKTISNYITEDNIALLSVIITILIYIFTRNAEIKYKKYDDKKIQYAKVINLLGKIYGLKKDKSGQVIIDKEAKELFFDTGSSLLLYGSKKIYRLYLLFRDFSTNPLIKLCKYYEENLIIYIIAEILVAIRKEVGLSWFNSIANNESLGFFINDLSNPIARSNSINAKFKIRMIRFELAIIDRTKFIWFRKIYSVTLRPVFAAILILIKYIIKIPFGKLICKLFPNFAQKFTEQSKELAAKE